MTAIRFAALSIVLICCATRAETVKVKGDAAARAYLSGNGFLNRGMYELAVDEYHRFLSDHADHEKASVARYGLGVALLRLSRFDEALEALEPLSDKPDFEFAAESAMIRGQCRMSRKEYGRAAAEFKIIVQKHKKHDLADDAAAGLAEALYLDGKTRESADRCERFIENWPQSPIRPRVEFFRGLSESANGNDAAAAEQFTKLLDSQPDGVYARRAKLFLAQARHRNGEFDDAVKYYRQSLGQNDVQDAPAAMFGLASILSHRGELAEAGRMLDRLLEEYPQSELRPAALLQRGRVAFDQGSYDQASAMFAQSSRETSLADQAAYWFAKCALRRGLHAEAAERLSQAIHDYPDSPLAGEMHYDRAVALSQANQPEAALEAAAKFLERFSGHAMVADATYLSASMEHRRENYDASLSHCRLFLERHPAHVLIPAVEFLIAENEFLSGRYERAVDAYSRFVAGYGASTDALRAKFRIGGALFRLNRLDEAAPLLRESVERLGTDGPFRSALRWLGEIHFERQEWPEAARYLEQFLEGDDATSDDDAWLRLGLARLRQQQYEPALTAFDAVIAKFQDSSHRLQAQFERGQTLLAMKRSVEAAEAFHRVIEQGSESRFAPHAKRHLGLIAIGDGNYDQAAGYLDVAASPDEQGGELLFQRAQALIGAERFAEAESALRECLKAGANQEYAGAARGQLVVALSRQDRCADALNAAERFESEGAVEVDAALRANVQCEKAWCLRSTGRTDDAAHAYRSILAQSDSSSIPARTRIHAMVDLAALEMDAKRFDVAAELLAGAWRLANEVDMARDAMEQIAYRTAVCEYEMGRFAEAAKRFEEFLEAFPGNASANSAEYFCGESHYKAGRCDRAVEYLTRAVDKPVSGEMHAAGLLRLGECLAAGQRWRESEESFVTYLGRFAEGEMWFQAQFGVGWAMENQRRFDEAMDAYRKVVDRHQGPTAARAQFQIGECLFARNEFKEAVRELLKVDIHYAYPEWSAAALFEAARCLEQLTQVAEAREQYRTVTEKYPDTRWAQMARQRLAVAESGGVPGQ